METLSKHPFDTLSSSQKDVAETLKEYLLHGTIKEIKQDFVVLKGYAGTGKTYTINKVIDLLDNLPVAMTAPTHKAVQILRKTSDKSSSNIVFSTIYSLLGLTQAIDSFSGKISYVESKVQKEVAISKIKVLIVDEASMLDPALFEIIMKYYKQNDPNLRIVFTGDPLQAPPVKQEQSPVFLHFIHLTYIVTILELSEPMRQAENNPILEYATAIRQNILEDVPYTPFISTDTNEGIEEVTEENFTTTILPYFGEQFEKNPNYMKVLAWTNETVNRFNAMIRSYRLNNPTPPKIVIGDYLVVDKPIRTLNKFGNMVPVANTSEEMKVISAAVDSIQIPVKFYKSYAQIATQLLARIPETERANAKEWVNTQISKGPIQGVEQRVYTFSIYSCVVALTEIDTTGKERIVHKSIRIIHESSEKLYKDIVTYLTKTAKEAYAKGKAWKEYYWFQDLFAQVKYNYALTVHKSQGSTYENCLVCISDINRNKLVKNGVDTQAEERNRLKYVAVTRAKKKLFILP